jgi:hypothetical protein
MKVIQAEHKLSKYSLNSVSEHFIQEKIVSYKILSSNQLEVESKNLHFLKVGNYVKLVNQIELEYGLKEEAFLEDEGYCDEKYRIIDISGNKMIIQSKSVIFTDDGIKEQTVEAINHIKVASLPQQY